MKAALHISEPQPGLLLVTADAFQKLLTLLLGNAGAPLPLLDTLREDLIDATANAEKSFKNNLQRYHLNNY